MKSHASLRPLVIGNWKLNPATVGAAKKLFLDVRNGLGRRKHHTEIFIAPPFPFLSELQRLSPSQRIGLLAQDVFFTTTGAYTGEVSMPMLQSVGATGVIIGHSERRALGETDDIIYKDIQAALACRALVVLCVGERERDSAGNYFSVVEAQLRAALRDVKVSQLKQIVIAYEPVWAIGTGKTATAEDAREMKLFIQKLVADRFERAAIKKLRILYGGSVKGENAHELLTGSGVDGFLVGGASLKAKEFIKIIETTESHAKESVA